MRRRARILEAICRLDYRPNAAARQMVGKRLNTIQMRIALINGESPRGVHELLAPELIVRATTAPPP